MSTEYKYKNDKAWWVMLFIIALVGGATIWSDPYWWPWVAMIWFGYAVLFYVKRKK